MADIRFDDPIAQWHAEYTKIFLSLYLSFPLSRICTLFLSENKRIVGTTQPAGVQPAKSFWLPTVTLTAGDPLWIQV